MPAGPYRVMVGDRELRLTDHALERWQERVRPGLTTTQLLDEIQGVLAGACVQESPPAWAAGAPLDGARPDGWIEPCDGIALPVVRRYIVTVLTRAPVSHKRRPRSSTQFHGKVRARERHRARELRERGRDDDRV